MKNSFGNSVTVTLFGESHGDRIGCVLDGLGPGLRVDPGQIARQLEKRRPFGAISTSRQEPDRFEIVSGVLSGRTTGTPICILIPNTRANSEEYETLQSLPRPGHADFTAEQKYHGFQDRRGGGHFSGRLTAPLVAAGAIVLAAMEDYGVRIGTHVSACAGIPERGFEDYERDFALLEERRFPVLDAQKSAEMQDAILQAKQAGDSVGGVLETAVTGLPAGLGEPWFDSVESLLSHMLFAIPAVKGVEFGLGFGFAGLRGSQANDGFLSENGRIVTGTNHNGGLNGGLTNGMPLLFRTAVKPTPSISLPQQTVDLKTGEAAILELKGRHDPAIVHRAAIVQTAVTALVLADLLVGRFGTDVFLQKMR